MRQPSIFKYFILTGAFLLGISTAHAQTTYSFETVARTGISIDGSNPLTALGKGPSLNNSGKVAFIGQDEPGDHGRVFMLNGAAVERNFYIFPAQYVGHNLQVNDLDQIAWQDGEDVTGTTYIHRLDNNGDDLNPLIATSLSTSLFEYVAPWPTINNEGLVVFSADMRSGTPKTVLASRDGDSGPHNISLRLGSFPNLYPMVTDYGETIVRFGGTLTSPLYFFYEPTYTANPIGLASSTNYYAIGEKPGTSDDGFVVAYMANHKTSGPGIYGFAYSGSQFVGPFKIADISITDPDNDYNYRVGVNRVMTGVQNDFVVTYLAKNPSGVLGLYSKKINITNAVSPTIATATKLAEIGQTIGNFVITVADISMYDPINARGEIAFWIRTTAGTQAIVVARPDNTPPTGTISINSGAAYSRVSTILLTLSATDTGSGVESMQFSNNGTTWSPAELYATSKYWNLFWPLIAGSDGIKTVYVKFKDAAGNWSPAVSDTILLDTIRPTATSTLGASNATTITLNASTTDPAPSSKIDKITYTIRQARIDTNLNTMLYYAGASVTKPAGSDLTAFSTSTEVAKSWFGASGVVYIVAGLDKAGNSMGSGKYWYDQTSQTLKDPDTTAPVVPAGFAVTGTTITSATLAWDPSPDASGYVNYEIYRNGTLIKSTVRIVPVGGQKVTYTDSNLISGTQYSYQVLARDMWNNKSVKTAAVTAYVGLDPLGPTAPTSLQANQFGYATSYGYTVSLSWGASTAKNGSTIAAYEIFRNGQKITTTPNPLTVTSYMDQGVAETTYEYKVRAIDSAGRASAFSNTVMVTLVN